MVWAVIIVSVLGFLAYLLFMPLELCLDTYRDRYHLRIGVLGRAAVEKDAVEIFRIHLKVLFMDFYWRPSDLSALKSRTKKRTSRPKNGKGPGLRSAKWIRLVRTFEIKQFQMELDTGDPITNARLYPVCSILKPWGGDIQVNFRNRNHLLLKIINRPIYFLNAIINH